MLKDCKDRAFLRSRRHLAALARLRMWQTGYPLHVMHGYAIPAGEALEFFRLVHRVNVDTLSNIEVVTNARRPLLAYAALVIQYIVRIGKPKRSCIGARRAQGYALFAARTKRQRKGCADRGGARCRSLALAIAAAWRRADRLDRSFHGFIGA